MNQSALEQSDVLSRIFLILPRGVVGHCRLVCRAWAATLTDGLLNQIIAYADRAHPPRIVLVGGYNSFIQNDEEEQPMDDMIDGQNCCTSAHFYKPVLSNAFFQDESRDPSAAQYDRPQDNDIREWPAAGHSYLPSM